MSEEFYEAATFGELTKVKKMLVVNPSLIHSKIEWGFTALHGVAAEEQFKMAKYLLENGADPVAKNDEGITPLHLAVYPKMIELLVQQGTDVNVRSNDGSTPLLTQAAESDGFDTMKALLKLGADPDLKDNQHQTALHIAKSREEDDKIALLKKHGAT
jgi:uncharacterized protein